MIIAAVGHAKQETKRLCQQLKEAETEIQLYNTEPRNRAERRAKTRTKTKKKAGRNTCR